MAKSSKKRKAKVADFVKPKFKLGKGKQPPTNAVDTSFKARSIALPTQSITIEKDEDVPTTRRKLTFDDLLSHIKHHNAGIRRDSILGFRELFEAHPSLIHSSLSSLLQTCAKAIGDEDASVRKAFLSFLTWLLPNISREILIPHSTLLLLFTTSAQTHIVPAIRVDSVRFLDLFLDHFPDIVVEGWTEGSSRHSGRILEGYLGLLNTSIMFDDSGDPARATSTLTVTLSPASKMIVMQSLSTFLRCALSKHATPAVNDVIATVKPWYLASSFSSLDAFSNFHDLLCPASQKPLRPYRSWKAEVNAASAEDDYVQKFDLAREPLESYWTLQQLSDVVNVDGSLADADLAGDANVTFIIRLARAMHSILISTFLDCAPNVFSPNGSTSEVDLKLVVVTGEVTHRLYAAIFQAPNTTRDRAYENLRTMLGYMATYFPFRASGKCDIKMEEALQNLNIIFCELSSLLVLSSQSLPRAGTNKQHVGTQISKAAFTLKTARVSEHVVQLLHGDFGSSSQLGRPLTHVAYTALLPTIWSLLNNSSSGHHQLASDVLEAVIEHAIKTPSKSAVKKTTIQFVGRLILMETDRAYQGSFRLEKHPEGIANLKEWIIHLPKTLWELGSNNMLCTETILLFLLRLFQRKSYLMDSELINAVRSRLVPYFSITHAVKGQLPGPFATLPSPSVRKLTLGLVAMLAKPGSSDRLEGVVHQSVVGTEEESYWNQLSFS